VGDNGKPGQGSDVSEMAITTEGRGVMMRKAMIGE
jgi:hypothetical protein